LLAVLVGLGMVAAAAAQKRPARPAPAAAPGPAVVPVPVIVVPRQGLRLGYNPRVRVLAGSRLEPTFAAADDVLASTPRDALVGYQSRQQRYQLYIPTTYQHNQAHPLILFLSASSSPDEFTIFDALCRKYGVLFACPYNAGDDCAPGRRLRIALDTLEDVRQRLNVDTDRIYLAGFSGGGRLASDIACSYPEFVGGVLALGGTGGLRNEPWMRDRVVERLSVALAVGEYSPVRQEVERWRWPALRDGGVRTKLWLTPRLGQAMPPVVQLEEMFVWLELGRAQRRALGGQYPPARMAEGTVPSPDTWAAGVLAEARKRLASRKTRESGLMQLEGVITRWKDAPAAEQADRLLKRHDDWEKVFARRQLEFAYREAKAVDAYLEVLTDPQRLPGLLRVALGRWEQVEKHGPDGKEGKEARRRLGQLRRLVPPR
jgi:pimeloyl-ACP methyl ester carboxylesterase